MVAPRQEDVVSAVHADVDQRQERQIDRQTTVQHRGSARIGAVQTPDSDVAEQRGLDDLADCKTAAQKARVELGSIIAAEAMIAATELGCQRDQKQVELLPQ